VRIRPEETGTDAAPDPSRQFNNLFILSDGRTRLERAVVLEWFRGRAGFEASHRLQVDEAMLGPLIA
jgi:hypothetical protein